jgi:hypothetical protein
MSTRTPEEIVAELQRTIPVLREQAARVMHDAVDLTSARMSEAAPKGRTGKLSETIRTTVRETAGGVTGTVRPGARYAGFVDKGSGLYAEHHSSIRAKAGKVLRFIDSSGNVVYRAQVKGQPAQPFVEESRDSVAAEVQALLEAGAVKATEELF